MSGVIRAYLDETPGETRGIVADDHGWQRVLTDFEGDDPGQKLGARSIGRVARIEPALRGVFVDLAATGGAQAFLPVAGGARLHEGQKIEVEVVSEPRETKGVTLRLVGKGEGEPRLLTPGPTIREWLARFAPGAEPIEGVEAIEAGWRAVQEATEQPDPPRGPSVCIERTRALVAVDFDYRPPPGQRGSPGDRLEANRRGLRATARALRLRSLGGLVAVDLIGGGQDGAALLKTAKAEFGADPDISFGPVNRFGVMMMTLPWRFQPLEDRLFRPAAERIYLPRAGAAEAARRLRHALLKDTTAPRITLRCAGPVVNLAGPLVARLGPRAHLKVDDTLRASEFVVDTD